MCNRTRRPYHVVMTAASGLYQEWQSRIAYYHWKKQRAADGPCTDMAAFHRLCATPGGKPDGLEVEMDTIFTTELPAEVLASHFHFGVLNRPNSFKQLFEVPGMLEKVTSPFVMILEPTT